jgi:peptidoglycan/xylan/chitin deacetylase (PgdA/CDA1 family)
VAAAGVVDEAAATEAVSLQVAGVNLTNARAAKARAFLTFDDGPSNEIQADGSKAPVITAAILDRLAAFRRELAAPELCVTFFWVGRYVERHPDIVRRAHGEGHCIANHSWSHPHLDSLTDADVRLEIERANDMVAHVTGGFRPTLFRAPYGEANARTASIIRAAGMTPVNWTVDTGDWAARSIADVGRQTETILANFQTGLAQAERAGKEIVILCHDGARGADCTLRALDIIVPTLLQRGYALHGLNRLT